MEAMTHVMARILPDDGESPGLAAGVSGLLAAGGIDGLPWRVALPVLGAAVADTAALVAWAERWVGCRWTCHKAKRQQSADEQGNESFPHDCPPTWARTGPLPC
jgi:hypothetical protein